MGHETLVQHLEEGSLVHIWELVAAALKVDYLVDLLVEGQVHALASLVSVCDGTMEMAAVLPWGIFEAIGRATVLETQQRGMAEVTSAAIFVGM